MQLNLRVRFKNKAFIMSFASAVILLIQQLGLGQYIPENLIDIINTLLIILSMLGIVVDPTTSGMSDSPMVVSNETSDNLLANIDKLNQEIEELKEKLLQKENEVSIYSQ